MLLTVELKSQTPSLGRLCEGTIWDSRLSLPVSQKQPMLVVEWITGVDWTGRIVVGVVWEAVEVVEGWEGRGGHRGRR